MIPFSGIRRLFYYHKGGFYYYDRYRKGTLAGPAPIGGSPGTESRKREKSTNPQAHSDRGNSGKGAAGSADDGSAGIGGIPITKNTAKRLKHSEGLRATGGRFLFPKGALTHHLVVAKSAYLRFRLWRKLRPLPCSSSPHKAGFVGPPFRRWYCCFASAVRSPRGMRLLREPMDNAALLRKCRHCPRRRSRFPLETTAALPAKTCHRQLCRRDGRRTCTVHFLFCERETEIDMSKMSVQKGEEM